MKKILDFPKGILEASTWYRIVRHIISVIELWDHDHPVQILFSSALTLPTIFKHVADPTLNLRVDQTFLWCLVLNWTLTLLILILSDLPSEHLSAEISKWSDIPLSPLDLLYSFAYGIVLTFGTQVPQTEPLVSSRKRIKPGAECDDSVIVKETEHVCEWGWLCLCVHTGPSRIPLLLP